MPMSVLLIEYDVDRSRYIRKLLSDTRVNVVSNTISALQWLAEGQTRIVLLSHTGDNDAVRDMVRSLRRASPEMPVIVLAQGPIDEASLLRAGAQDILYNSELMGPRLQRAMRYAVHRQEREQHLLQIESRYQHTFDTAPIGIAHIGQNGEWLEVNQTICDITGYSPDELLQIDFQTITHPDDLESDLLHYEALRRGDIQHYHMEKRYIHKQGHVVWILLNVTLQRDDWGRALHAIAIVQDISERKRIEAALQLSNERFQVTLKNSPITVWMQDLNLRYIWVHNPPFDRAVDFVIGKTDDELQEEHEDAAYLSQLKRQVIDSGVGLREEVILHIQGVAHYYDMTIEPHYTLDGQIEGVICATTDITPYKKIQQAEREQRALAEALWETAIVLTSSLQLDEVLDRILENVERLVHADAVDVMLYNAESETVRVMRVRGYDKQIFIDGFGSDEAPIAYLPLIKQVLDSKLPLTIPDVHKSPDWVSLGDGEAFGSYANVPIMVKDEVIGFLSLYGTSTQAFEDAQISGLTAFAQQAGLAIQNAKLYKQIQTLAIMEERQRLARDLHDAVSQALFTSNMIAEALPALVRSDPSRLQEMLDELVSLNRGAMAEMRVLLMELRPERILYTSFPEHLRQLSKAMRSRKHVQVHLQIEGQHPVDEAIKVPLYRIAQEAINNIVKHSAARNVSIQFDSNPDSLDLIIHDDGRGFDTTHQNGGMGMSTMRERAENIGATFMIDSEPGSGTTLHILLSNVIRG